MIKTSEYCALGHLDRSCDYIADMIENKVNLPDWLVALLTVATKKSGDV